MKQTINKRLTLWLLTLALAVVALPALTAPAQAAKTPVDVVFGSETVKGEQENPHGTTFVYCENVTYTLEKPDSNDPYYAAYTTRATGDIRIADTVDGKEVRKIRSGFAKDLTGKVTLGKNIRSLDYSVFSGGKLREVTIPEGSNLYRICQYAFRECPNLVRVGVGNTDKLPAGVTDIDYYAFYKSPAIQSIDLSQTKVKSIGDCTFTDCAALASVKLPDALVSIGHSAFKGCAALKALDVPASVKFIGMDTFSYSGIMDLKLRCGAVSPEGMSIARSLLALPDGAKVYLPRPSTAADYEKAMQFIYGNGQYTYCGANAKVKTYWMDNNNNTTAPVTEPSARSNSVVTLSGADTSGKSVDFTYNYNGDANGLGAVIYLNGRQKDATLKLTLNGSGTTDNTNAVIFTRVRAYGARHQGNIDSEAYSGKELTELLLRQQAVNYNSSASSSMSRDMNLALSSSDKLGLYYYIPTLVNKGSTSQPMNAKTLPPVLVVYTPTDGKDEGVGLEASFGSSNKWFCGDAENADFSKTGLPGAYPLYADGFEACFGTESDALTKGKAAYFNGGKNAITYQWKRVNKDGSTVLQTISASNYDYSRAGEKVANDTAAATFNCYEDVLPRGLQYCIGGLSGSYLQNLYNSSGTGTYYFQPTITVTVNDKVTNSVTGPIQSITFYDELTLGDPRMTVDYTDSGTGNATGPAEATGAPYPSIKLYTLKRNTINALAAPQTNLWGLKNKDYDGTIVYDWYYENNASGSTKVYFKDAGPNLPLDQLAKATPGTYTVFCNVSVRNSKGETVLKSNSGTSGFYCWVEVTSAAANYPAGMPRFDNFPKAIYFDLSYQSGNFKIPAPGTNMFAGSFSTRKLELFEVDSRDQNRGGVLRISGTVKMDNDGEFARISDINTPGVDGNNRCVFPNYKARWCYYKYTLTDSAGNNYVVYSPTVAVQPSLLNPPAGGPYFAVKRNAAMPEKVEVKVTGQPHSEYWLPNTGNVTLTAELETKNYPLIYRTSLLPTIFRWHNVDADKDLTANANFTQSARIDSVDIDADGNLLLKGALTATFKRGSGSSDDYFDATLPDGTSVSDPDRRFDLRWRNLVVDNTITWIPSSFTDPLINTVTIHPNAVSVSTPTVSVTGGRMVPVWNGDTGKYEWGEAPAGEFAENEYRLFSEGFDGKTTGDYSNIPASPEAVEITANGTSGATIRWRVTVSDGTGNVRFTKNLMPGTPDVTYDSAEASNGYAPYEDKATAAWMSSGSSSTLTVAIPTGAKAMKLTVQPMAVKTNGDQITGLAYGEVYEVYTNRAAKATTPTISNVYSGAPTYKVSRDQLRTAEDAFEFASPNIWVGTGGRGDTTYRWYLSRVEDERSVDIGTAIPLSEEKTVSGGERDYSVLPLTAELLKQHCNKVGDAYNDTLYIYAYAQNYDPSATQVQYAEKLMKVCEVVVADFYAMPAVTIDTPYTGASTVDIYHGQKAPEEMFSITIPLPADKTRYSVRLRGEAKSTDGTMAKDQSTGSVAILRDDSAAAGAHSGYEKRGNYYVYIPTMTYSSNVPQMTVNIDEGTATFTVDQRYFPNLALTSIYVSGSGSYESANMDFDFYWYVYGEYFGSKNTATGGDRTETTGKKYTVHRRQYPLSLTNLSFYSGTDASYSGTIPTDTAFWGGETPATTLPGFRQHSSGYSDIEGLRPVTVTVGSTDAPWVLVRMELWNEQNEWERMFNSSMVSATGETREYKDGSTTYTLVKQGSTVSLLTGPGAYFGGSTPQFMRIAAYPMGVDAFADESGTLTSITPITPIKQIFVVQPLTGEVVHAATPVCSNSGSYADFTFIARDNSMTAHTFGANAWTVSDGGTLSYQWKFYNKNTGEFENIAGETKPTLTVTKDQVRTWCENNERNYTSLQLVVTNTNTKPEITGNRYVTETYSTTVYYEDRAVTPRVSITSSGDTTFNLGEQGGTLTGTVSNPAGELTTPSYAWGCRVTRAVRNDDAVYTAPADTAFYSLSKDDVAGADTDTLKLYAINGGSNYEIDGSLYPLTGWNSLWASYKEVTIEYQLAVTENYTPTGGSTTSATGTSNIIPVTIKRPEPITALTVTQNGAHPVPPYVLRDDAPLTFTAPAAAGSAPRSYVWAHSSSATENSYSTVSNWTEQTLVLTKDGHWSSAPYILCVMTDTYTDPNSKKTLELETESERILVQYMGAEAAVPQFTKPAQTVAADPGATGKSFDSTAIVSEPGATITYAWKKINTLNGEVTALSDTTATLSLNGYIPTVPGKWSFVCTATNKRSDGKTAENTITHTLYVRGAVLTANLTEVDIAAGDSAEITLTATTYGLDGAEFNWSTMGMGTPKWSLTGTPSGTVSGDMTTVTNTARLSTAAGSTGSITTQVFFNYTPSGGSEQKTFIPLKANLKPFAVVAREIDLTMGEAVPTDTKLTVKGTAADVVWSVVNYDELNAAGVTVNENGTLSGTPTVPGPYRVEVQATNGTTTAKGIVTVYVKIPERAGFSEYATVTVGENTYLDVSENHSGSGWSWDTRTGVLTLDNYTGGRLEASGFGTAPLYIRLRGSSSLTEISGDYGHGTVLCGSGNLTVSGGTYLVQRDVDVRGSGKIKLIGTTPERSAVYGKLTVGEKGDVEITSSVDGYTAIEGTLAVNGGKLNITLTGARSKGIAQERTDTEITGGTATITVKGSHDCRGISGGGVQVSGGKLTVDVEILGDSSRIDTYAVYIPNWSLSVSGGGEFNIIGKQTRYGIYDPAWITVDGGTLNVDVTRTDNDREVFGVRQFNNRECHVKNGGVLKISVNTPYDSAGSAGHAKGLATDVLNVYEGSTATITAKSGGIANAVELEHITCDGIVNLNAETERGTASASASNTINVWGKGRLKVDARGKFASPFYNVKFNGSDGAKPLTVTTHAKSTVADGVAYLNSGQVTTAGNVNVTMTVESAVPGARAYGIQNSMSLNHTAGSITLKAAAGTTLETQLTGSVSYDAAKIAVTGNPKGKDFVTYTAISPDALLISNASGGAVTLYQNTELSTDELTFTASGGTAPYTWTRTGTLPAGMRLSAAEGAQVKITGTPTTAGSSTFTLTATDKNNRTASATVTVTVDAADLVFAYSTSGIFRDGTLYLPLSSDWATNPNRSEELHIESVSGDIDKKRTSAESDGVLRCYASYSDSIKFWIKDASTLPKVGNKGTFTVTLRNGANEVVETYTYNYEFVKDNPRYLTVGSRKFPAMLGDASGTGSKGSWSWDCASSTLTLDNYEGKNGNSLVWADRKFSGLTVIYKGNVVADGVRYINHENLPGLTYKALNDNATLTMKQQSSSYKDYGVGADITFEGGNVTLYPRRRLVDPNKSEKVYVKDAKQFIISDVWLYYDETLKADVVEPQYTTDYWLYKAADDRVMSCGSAAPTLKGVEIQGPSTISQSGSIALTAQVFPTWLPDAKKYSSSANEELGAAFGFEYHWYSGGTELAGGAGPGITTSASNLFGTTLAVGAEKTVKCTAQLAFGGSSSAAVTSADHTVTVVADGVTVSGTAVSWNDTDNAVYLLYDDSTSDTDIKAEWKVGTYTKALTDTPVKGGITANSDGKRHDQTFRFEAIPEGNYKLVIYKPGKYVPKIVPITVGTSALDLGQLKLWLYGDVNYDGLITSQDVLQIQRKIAGKSSILDSTDPKDRFSAANVTAITGTDTELTSQDITQIQRMIAGKSSIFDAAK